MLIRCINPLSTAIVTVLDKVRPLHQRCNTEDLEQEIQSLIMKEHNSLVS